MNILVYTKTEKVKIFCDIKNVSQTNPNHLEDEELNTKYHKIFPKHNTFSTNMAVGTGGGF